MFPGPCIVNTCVIRTNKMQFILNYSVNNKTYIYMCVCVCVCVLCY